MPPPVLGSGAVIRASSEQMFYPAPILPRFDARGLGWPLAASSKAAKVLGTELGLRTENLEPRRRALLLEHLQVVGGQRRREGAPP